MEKEKEKKEKNITDCALDYLRNKYTAGQEIKIETAYSLPIEYIGCIAIVKKVSEEGEILARIKSTGQDICLKYGIDTFNLLKPHNVVSALTVSSLWNETEEFPSETVSFKKINLTKHPMMDRHGKDRCKIL